MDFLLRKDAPFSEEQWNKIDELVVETAQKVLTGRKFIHLYGPLGAGVQSIPLDDFGSVAGAEVDFFGEEEDTPIKTQERRFTEIPLIFKDFLISWRDLENSRQLGLPLDFSSAAGAAAIAARKEDELIFLGSPSLGYEGLLTAAGSNKLEKSDWSQGENAFTDVAKGVSLLTEKGFVGKIALAVSPDLYLALHRLQANTGLLEIDRIKQLLNGNVYQTPVLGNNKAVLVAAEPQNLDLVIGQDLIAAYLGPEKLNHALRVLETIALRIKHKEAIVVYA